MTENDVFKDKEFREKLMAKFQGWTDDDIDKLTATQRNFILNLDKMHQYKLIAQVTEVNGCARRPKIGDKFVFSATGILLPEETTFPGICVPAITPMVSWVWMTYQRILEGGDPRQPFWLDRVRCLDMGPERGGWGSVVFQMYIEEK
jgi:hypothetical protein